MTFESNKFWNEVGIETLIEQAEEVRDQIISTVPHDEIYGIDGNLNEGSRWGATLRRLNLFISDLRGLGF